MSDEQRPPAADDGRRGDGDRGFRLIFEASPGALIVVDEAGMIEHANAEAGRIFGYFSGELLGRPVGMLIADHSDAAGAALFATGLRRPLGAGGELHARHRNGAQFLVEVGTRAIEIPAGRRTLIAFVDVSGRKGREAGADAGVVDDKDTLLREAHHRARSNLQIIQSLLDWQSPRIRDGAAAELLRESRNRIHSIGLIHQMLSQARSAASVDFQIFLAQLVPALVAAYRGESPGINLKLSARGVSLPSRQAVPCALLVTELVSNALKHAFPAGGGTIEIELVKMPGQTYQLAVADDGVGIPGSVEIDRAATPGLQLVGLLAKQLKAGMSVRRSAPARFEFRFEVAI